VGGATRVRRGAATGAGEVGAARGPLRRGWPAVSLDKAACRNASVKATDKLKEGIEGFSKALTELEKQLEPRLAAL
jgi:hypothetical protein